MVNRYSVKRNNILKSRSNKKIKKGYSNHRKCTVGIRQKKGEVSMVEKNTKKLNSSFEENIRYMNEILPVKESFDIIRREIIIGGKASVFYYIDGFIKDEGQTIKAGRGSQIQIGRYRGFWKRRWKTAQDIRCRSTAPGEPMPEFMQAARLRALFCREKWIRLCLRKK